MKTTITKFSKGFLPHFIFALILLAAVIDYKYFKNKRQDTSSEYGPAERSMVYQYGTNWRELMISNQKTNRVEFLKMHTEWTSKMSNHPSYYPGFSE